MNSEPDSDKIIPMNQAHCRMMAEKIHEMERRVRELEKLLVSFTSTLQKQVTWKLDQLFPSRDPFIEFQLPEGEGIIKISGENSPREDGRDQQTRLVVETLDSTRRQLAMIHETIASLQLAR